MDRGRLARDKEYRCNNWGQFSEKGGHFVLGRCHQVRPIDITLKIDQVDIQCEGTLEEFQASRYDNVL